ncbi:MAG: hypothetical protein OIF54_05440, partial [Cohaesibacter sp.]|nr:hypothetical protein [Cohaesibacter sp.]
MGAESDSDRGDDSAKLADSIPKIRLTPRIMSDFPTQRRAFSGQLLHCSGRNHVFCASLLVKFEFAAQISPNTTVNPRRSAPTNCPKPQQ